MRLLIIAFFISLSAIAAPKATDFFSFKPSDGLNETRIRVVGQDTKGYIWIGSNNNAYRYNASVFEKIPVNKFESDSNFQLSFFYFDKRGNVYAVSYNHIYKYIPDSNIFKKFISLENNIYGDYPLDSERLLIFCIKKVFLFNLVNQKITEYPIPAFKNKTLLSLLPYNDSYIAIFSYGNPQLVSKNFQVIDSFVLPKIDYRFKKFNVNTKGVIVDGQLMLLTYGSGIFKFDLHSRKLISMYNIDLGNIHSDNIQDLTIDNHKNIIIGTTDNELAFYNKKRDKFEIINNDYLTKHTLKMRGMRMFFRDKDSITWIAGSYGLAKMLNQPVNFNFIKIASDNYKANSTRSFLEIEKGILWIGTEKGIYELNENTGNVRPLNILNEHSTHRIIKYNKEVYICSHYGLYQVHKNKQCEKIYTGESYLNNVIYNAIFLKDSIIVLTGFGINSITKDSKRVNSMQTNRVQSMLALSDTALFYITYSNLYYHHILKNKTTIIYEQKDEIGSLGNSNETCWFTTKDSIFILNPTKDSWTCIPLIISNLPELKNKNLFFDNVGRLWISSHDNLFLVDLKSNKKVAFSVEKDLMNYFYLLNNFMESSSGKVWIAGVNGVNWFYPELIVPKFKDNSVTISRLFVNGKNLVFNTIDSLYKLSYNQNNIDIECCVLDYSFTSPVNFSYMLEGYSNEWINLWKTNKVSFHKLPPGKYIFRVKAISENDELFESKPLEIIIANPYYATWWFITLIIITVVIIIAAVILYRTYHLRALNQELQDKVLERTIEILEKNEELKVQNDRIEEQKSELEILNATKDKLFSIIAHDLRNPFNAISGFASLLANNFDDYNKEQKIELIKLIESSSNNAYTLLDNLLSWSRANLNVIQFKPEMVELKTVIQECVNFLHIVAENKNIQLSLNVEDINITADKNLMNTVIRNLISNALKYTNSGGCVWVEVERLNDKVRISINDNGVGLSKEQIKKLSGDEMAESTQGTEGEKGTGIGLVLCKDFIKRHQGNLIIESEPTVKTSFIVELNC